MAQSYAQFVVALILVLSLVGGSLALSEPVRAQTQPDVDTTVLRIEVHENTTATWELQIRTRLRTSDDEAEYRAFQRQFENDTDAYLGPFSDRLNGTVDAAGQATGREMNATGFEASTSLQSVPRQWGVVTYRFRWTNFAVERDGRLVVGDVFESGLFIAENDSLELVAPAGYRVASASPSTVEESENVLTWDGPESFADGEPSVTFEPKPVEEPSVKTTPSSTDSGIESVAGPLGIVFLVALVAAGAWWQQSSGPVESDDSSDGHHPGDGESADESANPDPGATRPANTPRNSSKPHDETEDGDESTTVGTGTIVTDEDRVRTLLREAGGRVRQKDVVAELDWSKSKVSRVLSRMEDDGTVEKLRLGRENVVELVSETDDDDDGETGA
ncbi:MULTISPECIES: MarR family transcriptional regulator [Haloferax]|uniref:MarR family transcriptional regulator n=1 Tax=Haloferax marinum TaxID=2666143 RepID=A0A6A8G2N5_9EURY|nr:MULTISPECIES: MarR family transcriptional regulator [Haloferax]KAB1196359.1 MarR family transcriptional regulator [Haloferax sp. CBA1150]MRW95351.1 MarR family transcriptional regulator [Haloferax marinum]